MAGERANPLNVKVGGGVTQDNIKDISPGYVYQFSTDASGNLGVQIEAGLMEGIRTALFCTYIPNNVAQQGKDGSVFINIPSVADQSNATIYSPTFDVELLKDGTKFRFNGLDAWGHMTFISFYKLSKL